VSLSFTAIDFETANPQRGSVCAVGAVKVRGGRIVEEYTTIVRPPPGLDDFSVIQQSIHGIGPNDVRNAPRWTTVYPILVDLICDDVMVAHNVEFDLSVLREACRAHRLTPPTYHTCCTRDLAKNCLSLASYKLPIVARHLGIAPFRHHDSLADARATAEVMLAIAELEQIVRLDENGLLGSSGATRIGALPPYVLTQSREATEAPNYNAWIRTCLANPQGRATGGEECVMCGQSIHRGLHWQLREHHVCGHRCNDRLKREANKMWRTHGIRPPR
jgi:DNA polymerase III subunit epsilon